MATADPTADPPDDSVPGPATEAADDAATDGAATDGAVTDGAVTDGAVTDAATGADDTPTDVGDADDRADADADADADDDADEPFGEPAADHRSGFVALCGRPNVGKSTLLNALLGQAVAVATPHPQTTREKLLGIWTQSGFQVVLVDTPGIHRARSALNRYMVGQAMGAARDVDVVLFLAECPRLRDSEAAEAWRPGPVALEGLQALIELGHPLVLVLTKADLLREPALLLPVIKTWSELHEFAAIVPVSAISGRGLEALRDEVVGRLPEGPRYYDPDQLSDRGLRWHAAELVRGELFAQLGQELPYSCAVTVTSFREGPEQDRVRAVIHVEREGQKGIVIGKAGRVIKALSMAARGKIQTLTGRPCDLRLSVTVARDWTKHPERLAKVGYDDSEAP